MDVCREERDSLSIHWGQLTRRFIKKVHLVRRSVLETPNVAARGCVRGRRTPPGGGWSQRSRASGGRASDVSGKERHQASIMEFENFSSVKASRRRRTPVSINSSTWAFTFSTPASANRTGALAECIAPRLASSSTATLLTGANVSATRHARIPGSAPWRRRLRPGTASSGSTAGDAHGSGCIRPSRRWGCARLELTRCGTSTPPSSACSTGHAPICTP
jgi:hypothetical protein